MDSNEDFDSTTGNIQQLKTTFNLKYPINTHNSTIKHIGTHIRGSKRIDGILVSQNITRHIDTISTTDPDLFCISYHTGIYVVLSNNVFKHRYNQDLMTPHNRRLKSNHIKTIKHIMKYSKKYSLITKS